MIRDSILAGNDQIELLLEQLMRLKPPVAAKPGGMALLTRREQEVVELVAEGMRNDKLSTRLNVAEHTIRNYLGHVFDKLGLSTRVELVLYVLSR